MSLSGSIEQKNLWDVTQHLPVVRRKVWTNQNEYHTDTGNDKETENLGMVGNFRPGLRVRLNL